MIVQTTIAFLTDRDEFLKMTKDIISKWNDSIPQAGHENDKLLILGTVNNTVINSIVLVTPDKGETLEICIQKYIAGDYTVSDNKPEDAFKLFG